MRYNLGWDILPFLTLLYLQEPYRNRGFGRQAMQHWEQDMRQLGYAMVMTSTQAPEQARHFYNKLGYTQRGSLLLEGTPMTQPRSYF